MRRSIRLLMGTGIAAAVALLALVIGVTPVDAKAKTKTFSNPSPVSIPDSTFGPDGFTAGFAKSNLRIRRKGKVKSVEIGMQITHPFTCELSAGLAKGDRYIPLVGGGSCGPGLNTANFGGGTGCKGGMTTFKSRANLHLRQASNPFAGSFLTDDDEFTLQRVRGAQLRGKWQLRVTESAPFVLRPTAPQVTSSGLATTGTIECFRVKAKYRKR